MTAIHLAAQKGDESEVRKLVAAGGDVNQGDANGNTPLKYAACEPRLGMLVVLLSLGADPRISDSRGFTPLHCVSSHGFYDEAIAMARILIDAGADPNSRSSDHGFVPLHEVRTVGMVEFLMASGADPTIRNDRGQTPAEYLQEEAYLAESKYLRQFAESGHS